MKAPDLIPVQDLAPEDSALQRTNPMIWEQEEPADGVFVGDSDDALALLGTPSLRLPEEPRLPADFVVSPALRARLLDLQRALTAVAGGERRRARVDLAGLPDSDREALPLMLGEGEVSGTVALDDVHYRIREAVMTGIWLLTGSDGSAWLEVAPVPELVERSAGMLRLAPVKLPAEPPPGVMNGLAVLSEVNEHAAAWDGSADHNRVLNFTLMPMSPEDQQLLIDVLGRAELALDSGGFGHCRVMATTVRHVWAVQYLSAMGTTILDTVEIGRVPDAVAAAAEDFEDSRDRLGRMLETYLS
jgi:hydrogenase-1 operon protein HyaF